MSLKPGLGKEWFDQFKWDIYPSDEVVTSDGKKVKVPAYYDALLAKSDPAVWKIIQETRTAVATRDPHLKKERTPERLMVREKCAKARQTQLKRQIQ